MCVRMCPYLSACVRICPDVSVCVRVCPYLSVFSCIWASWYDQVLCVDKLMVDFVHHYGVAFVVLVSMCVPTINISGVIRSQGCGLSVYRGRGAEMTLYHLFISIGSVLFIRLTPRGPPRADVHRMHGSTEYNDHAGVHRVHEPVQPFIWVFNANII